MARPPRLPVCATPYYSSATSYGPSPGQRSLWHPVASLPKQPAWVLSDSHFRTCILPCKNDLAYILLKKNVFLIYTLEKMVKLKKRG